MSPIDTAGRAQSRLAAFAIVAACLVAAWSPGLPAGDADSARIAAAIASPHRSDRDRDQDAARRPAEFLAFIDVADGDAVADINAGGGYVARLLAPTVGRSGQVYATNADFIEALFDGVNGRLAESVRAYPNVLVSRQSDDGLEIEEGLDAAILNNIYHDLHWQEIDVNRFNRSVYAALKPGGYYIVGDHSAAEGSGISLVADSHRIERDTVIREVLTAGFELVDEAHFLANPDDDRLTPIFDPAIRGRTDRFLLKFRRPE